MTFQSSPQSAQTRAAVVRDKGGPFQIETLTVDQPRDDEVLVRIVATGMCHTDIVIRDQVYPVPLPIVLGHEGAGIVERVGSAVRKVAPGDHVVLSSCRVVTVRAARWASQRTAKEDIRFASAARERMAAPLCAMAGESRFTIISSVNLRSGPTHSRTNAPWSRYQRIFRLNVLAHWGVVSRPARVQ